MPEIWYALLALMITGYAVLDGFDFGAGMLHLFVAKTEEERRTVIGAIGPFWDGNEVWLIAAGGVLFVAFPVVLAVAFPAFYLSLFIVIWCLTLRGIGLEVRSHVKDAMWRALWDVVFALGSTLLALLFGVALGNVVRGLPLDGSDAVTLPLFTDFSARGQVGLLDWYTALVGVFSCGLLAAHGCVFLQFRTRGALQQRLRRLERRLWMPVAVLFLLVSVATFQVRPDFFAALLTRPLAWLACGLLGLGVFLLFRLRGTERTLARFIGSALVIVGLLGALAAGLFPTLLHSTLDPARSLSLYVAASGDYARHVALYWWPLAFALAVTYVVVAFRAHRSPLP